MEKEQNMKKLEHLAITCGGTGGHFNPGLSVAQALNESGGEAILLLGGKHADRQLKIAAEHGVKAFKIAASPISKSPFGFFRFLRDVIVGKHQCRKLFAEYKPQALLSMGSYTSIPPALAARSRLPFFLHDGNARLGKANVFMSRYAKAFAFSFPSVNASAVRCPAVLTGFPLRPHLFSGNYTRTEAIRSVSDRFGVTFDPADPVLLITGGSLGAEKINTNISFDPADENVKKLQVIHLAGPGKVELAKQCYAGVENRVIVLESCDDMGLLYSASDFVISRAGGSTVSELAAFGKYALLIPYPFAAEHHQDDNAQWLASAGGAEILNDSDCTKTLFASILSRWVRDRDNLVAIGEHNRSLAMPDAAKNVLRMIEQYL